MSQAVDDVSIPDHSMRHRVILAVEPAGQAARIWIVDGLPPPSLPPPAASLGY